VIRLPLSRQKRDCERKRSLSFLASMANLASGAMRFA
jgi:hypothetical protein